MHKTSFSHQRFTRQAQLTQLRLQADQAIVGQHQAARIHRRNGLADLIDLGSDGVGLDTLGPPCGEHLLQPGCQAIPLQIERLGIKHHLDIRADQFQPGLRLERQHGRLRGGCFCRCIRLHPLTGGSIARRCIRPRIRRRQRCFRRLCLDHSGGRPGGRRPRIDLREHAAPGLVGVDRANRSNRWHLQVSPPAQQIDIAINEGLRIALENGQHDLMHGQRGIRPPGFSDRPQGLTGAHGANAFRRNHRGGGSSLHWLAWLCGARRGRP